jgi:hypothetical protein
MLLVETENGLVLIDSGFGRKDCGDPAQRVRPSRHLIRPVLNPAGAAVNQVERLGFRRDDALAAFEWTVAFDRDMVRQNHARLVDLYRRRQPDLFMICSHDRKLYEEAKATAWEVQCTSHRKPPSQPRSKPCGMR